ncbi:MAG TPA: M20/M25/M40 family metallo-hydrolase, partial [Thermoanaerobaculia bacterium]
MKRLVALAVLWLPIVVCAAESAAASSEETAAKSITPELIRSHIRILASDLFEGRGPSTRGDQLAEEYIATEMEGMGLAPGAPGGGWVQRVPLVGITPKVPDTITVHSAAQSETFRYRDDFMAFSGVQKDRAEVSDAEIVFVGYGIVAPEYRWDDFKDVDVKGKVLLVMNNDPENDPNLFAGKTRLWYGRWDYKYLMAARKGAAGVIIIHTTHSAGYGWQVVQTSWAGQQFELPDDGSPRLQVKMWATEDACRKIASLGGQDLDRLRAAAEKRDFRPVPLGVRVSIGLTSAIATTQSGNVIGKREGSDPKLSGEAVIYTAHFDHFGIKVGAKPGADAIYNGALDNASGVAAVLAVARAFAQLPAAPKRTVYFALVTAEEQGLLGSQYLAAHPPVPPGAIVANINIDGINWFGRTKDVTLVGMGKSSIDNDVVALAKEQGRTVTGDPFPDRGTFYRSDQFNFAKIGVPAAYLKTGIEVIGKPPGWGREQIEAYERNDYHQPSDELRDNWEFAGAVEDTQLAFRLGMRVANAVAAPVWKKGDEFEAAR